MGEAYNTDDKPVIAMAYAEAKNINYRLPDDSNYMKPEIINHLSDIVLPPPKGPLEAVEEVKIYIKFRFLQ